MSRAPAATVRITYCSECGYEDQALDLARALLLDLGAEIGALTLIPWDSGTFDVSVDGVLVHSMERDGGFPDASAVKESIKARRARPDGAA